MDTMSAQVNGRFQLVLCRWLMGSPDSTGGQLSQCSPFIGQAARLREVGPVTQGHLALEVDSDAVCLALKPGSKQRAPLQGHSPVLVM